MFMQWKHMNGELLEALWRVFREKRRKNNSGTMKPIYVSDASE